MTSRDKYTIVINEKDAYWILGVMKRLEMAAKGLFSCDTKYRAEQERLRRSLRDQLKTLESARNKEVES